MPPKPPRKHAYPAPVEKLIAEFARLPGIGARSAERLAFHLLKAEPDAAASLARAITDLKQQVRHCSICFNLADTDPCPICADTDRDRTTILVVEQPKDVIALEQAGSYHGLYHILMGRLSPIDGIGPEDLTISRLLTRIDTPAPAGSPPVAEVVLGLNPTTEGDGTALYLARELKRKPVRVTRLARGLPTGSSLEFVNRAVLTDAIQGRRALDD